MAQFTDAQAEVARLKTVVPQVVAVLNGFPAKVAAAVTAATGGAEIDQTAFDTLYSDIKSQTDALVAALGPVAP